MTVLILGGTGKVGAPLVKLLLERGQSVRVLVNHPERASLVPEHAETHVASLVDDPEACRAAFQDIEAVFMLNGAGLHESIEGHLAVAIARSVGVRRFVYQSSHSLSHLHQVPHLGAKLAIEQALKASGMAHTILRPNHFFQNDEESLEGIRRHGVYIQPIGMVGCGRVDVRDIAEAAANILMSPGHDGRTYDLVGPENLTGTACAERWAETLGRPVRYDGDIRHWQSVVQPFLPKWLVYDLGLMFAAIAQHGMLSNSDQIETVTKLLGRPPRSFHSYVTELVEAESAT